ncbi:MAG: isoprenyl transferase [Phycisphaerales bacterium]
MGNAAKGNTAANEQDKAALDRISEVMPEADPLTHLPDVSPSRIPRHIAIIMDGNGRWAVKQGKPRQFGHQHGAETVRRVIAEAGRIGVEFVTLYSFSTENWKRPEDEIRDLMALCELYCHSQLPELLEHKIRVRVIGRRNGLPDGVLNALDNLVAKTHENTSKGPTLCLALNYGSREEILDATRTLARRAASGEIVPDDITADLFSESLYTAGMPDPDLLIRTAGEMRISNYLLWQISYSELFVTDTLWPEFMEEDLHSAVRAYAARDRRFGGLSEGN